jgi:peptide/nickel transport system substrate-binding protein
MARIQSSRTSLVIVSMVFVGMLVMSCAPAAPPTATKPAAQNPAPTTVPAPTAPPAAQAPAAPTAPPAAASAPTAASKPTEQPAAQPTAVPAAAAKQELVIAQGTDPRNLDPHALNQQPTRNITQAVNEPLVDWDFSKNVLTPVLATEWKLLNPTTWQFKLRPNVTFSNGEPWNADAVKYNIERIKNAETKSAYIMFVADIDRVEVVDPMTVNMITKAPSPLVPMNLARIGMLAPKFAEKGLAEVAKAPVGTGPYKVTEYVADERTVLEPNPTYWGPKPTPTKVTFRPVPDNAARVASLKTGRADIITLVPFSDFPGISADSNLDVLGQPGMRGMYFQINTIKYDNPTRDKRVRQALNYAVDKDALIKVILGGHGAKLNGSIVAPGYFGYDPQLQPYPFDPDKAKQLLTEAGVPGGFDIAMTTVSGRYMADKELSEAVAGQLGKIGVKVQVNVKDYGVFTQDINDGTLGPLAFVGLSSIPDAGSVLGFLLSGGRFGLHPVPEFDRLLKEASQTLDDSKRADLLHQAAAAYREEAGLIFLTQQYDLYAFNKKVQNFHPLPDERIDFSNISIK